MLGNNQETKGIASQQVQFAAHTNDKRPVVLTGTVYQMGNKQITVPKTQSKVVIETTHVIACTAYKDEMEGEKWRETIKAPVRQILEAMGMGEQSKAMQGPPWGRSFSDGTGRCAPEQATSIQFHMRISEANLESHLKCSGKAGVYTQLRTEDRKPSSDYAVIWLNKHPVELQATAAQHEETRGLIRVTKRNGKTSRGIRVKAGAFEKLFKLLRPGEATPNIKPLAYLAKVEPVPKGASAEEINEWLQEVGWRGRAVKALSDKTWIVGSDEQEQPTDVFQLWNATPIMFVKINSRYRERKTPILAGRPPRPANPVAAGEDPWRHQDPWSKGLEKMQKQTEQNGAQAQGTQQAKRQVEGPLEQRFAKQQKEIDDLKKTMQNMGDTIQKNQEDNTRGLQGVKQEVMDIKTEMASKIGDLFTGLNETIKESLKEQEDRQNTKFDRIEGMIKTDRPSPPRKGFVTAGGDRL